MDRQQMEIRASAVGRISKAPELARTLEGVAICRFTVAADVGLASNPLVKEIYVKGDPALRPSEDLPVRIAEKLGVGDLVFAFGKERQRIRRRKGVEFIETAIEAADVRLKGRAGATS